MGKENITSEDLIVPRVALAASISPCVIEGKCEAGHFFHTVTEQDLGPEMRITVIHHSRRYTLWKPRHQGGGVLARASDGRHWDIPNQKFEGISIDKNRPKYLVTWETGEVVSKTEGLGMWGTMDPANEDSAPAATLCHVLLCVNPDDPELGPFVVMLQRSAEPVAKSLLTKMDLDRAPIFGQVYRMGGKVDTNKSNEEFFNYTFTKDGYVTQALYEEFKELHMKWKETSYKVDDREDMGDGAAPEGGSRDRKAADAAKDEDRY